MVSPEVALYEQRMVAAMREEWGLDGITQSIKTSESLPLHALEDRQKLQTGVHDDFLLSAIASPLVDLGTKSKIITSLSKSIFHDPTEDGKLNGVRTGRFLGSMAHLHSVPATEKELKGTIKASVNIDDLKRSLDESAQYQWKAADVSAVAEGYSTLQTLEEAFGIEKARETFRRIHQSAISGRLLDEFLERGAREVTGEGRGFSIWLGVRGAEVTETIIKDAYFLNCIELGTQPHISPYYRNIVLTTHFSSDLPDERENLLTPAQTLAQQFRTKVNGVRGPTELPVAANVNNMGEVSILPATPQVGLTIPPATGFAYRLARETKLNNGKASSNVLNVFGDGALPMFSRILQEQGALKTPVVNVLLNNKIAIGVEQSEVWGGNEMYGVGEAYGVPGVHVGIDGFEKLYLASYFASNYTALGGGSFTLEVDTIRLAPHSNAHGNSQGAKLIRNLEMGMMALSKEMPYIGDVAINDLTFQLQEIGAKSNLMDVKRGLLAFMTKYGHELIVREMTEALHKAIEQISDPNEVFEKLYGNRYWSDEESDVWRNEALKEVSEAYDAAIEADRPKSIDNFNNHRLLYPQVAKEWSFPNMLSLTGAEAERLAIREAMENNPHILYMGADVNKGQNYHVQMTNAQKQIRFHQAGGYWGQSEDLAIEFPDQVINSPIDEWTVAAFLLGYGLTSTDGNKLKNAPIGVFHGQYKDYGDYLIQALKDLGSLMLTTNGQMTRRFLYLATAGMTPGGGTGHAREDMGYSFMTPYEIPIFYPSRPSDIYHLLSHLFRNGINTPTIFAWDRNCWNQKQTFKFDPNIAPGRARVAKEGNDLQVLTFGPSVNNSVRAIEKIGVENAAVMDLFTIRPFPEEDVFNFLSQGIGPIAVVQEDPKGQGFGDIMISQLLDNPRFREIISNRGINLFGTEPISAIPCDGVYQSVIKPDLEQSFRILLAGSK